MPDNRTLLVETLAYRYGNTLVWEDVSFDLKQGEVAFLVGHNGAGKSTLLRCLAGWAKPYAGNISVCGHSVYKPGNNYRSHCAFVPDTPIFYEDLTAKEHIDFVLNANNMQSKHEEAQGLMNKFGLSSYGEQVPSSYSRGMKEKLALVILLTMAPPILLLDEAYGPLDSDSQVLLSQELNRLAKQGSSIILSCHHSVPHLKPNFTLCLNEGKLLIEKPDEVKPSSEKQTNKIVMG